METASTLGFKDKNLSLNPYLQNYIKNQDGSFRTKTDNEILLQGIIMSEILGPPRARKGYRFNIRGLTGR